MISTAHFSILLMIILYCELFLILYNLTPNLHLKSVCCNPHQLLYMLCATCGDFNFFIIVTVND